MTVAEGPGAVHGMSPGTGPLDHHGHCFVCGEENPAALGPQLAEDGDVVRGTVRLGVHHQGVPGVAHGGALAALADEVGGSVLLVLGERFVTANLSLDYVAPVLIGEELDLVASLVRSEDRKRWVEVAMTRGGATVAVARLLFVTVEIQHFADLGVDGIDALFGGGVDA